MKRAREERAKRLEALRTHLYEGAKQAKHGEFVELKVADVVARAKKRIRK